MASEKEIIDAIVFNTDLVKDLKWEDTLSNLQNSRNALYALDRVAELARQLAEQVESSIADLV